MITSVRIKFDKYLHDTDKAILVRIGHTEYWLPKKLCRKFITNQKLGGNVCIPTFLADRLGICYSDDDAHILIVKHVPSKKEVESIEPNKELMR